VCETLLCIRIEIVVVDVSLVLTVSCIGSALVNKRAVHINRGLCAIIVPVPHAARAQAVMTQPRLP